MSLYFAAITGRDFIKHKGKKIPFWNLLDNPPDGWLTSLTNIKSDIPKSSMRMFDCGAWTYRDEDTPVLKGKEVSPESAYAEYMRYSTEGDFLIAPDHMLLPGKDNVSRNKINHTNAIRFLEICDPVYNPVVCIHGVSADERVENFIKMKNIGYSYFALGGLAARAKERQYCIDSVKRILKEATSGDWVHVLGLSSITYAKQWNVLNVSSFDGSSHFFRALTAGYFYDNTGRHHIASRPGEKTEIVECYCKACTSARDMGGDTRFYGNSINNIGRAAHNLNIAVSLLRKL